MSSKAHIPSEVHKQQINAYKSEIGIYERYADALDRVFRKTFPLAVVQAREKTLSSFAEKCARKYETYPDAVSMMTDLCGARIVVQTLGLLGPVRQFIEKNFTVLEFDDKSRSHAEDEFGYNDMHYIVQVRPDRDIGFTDVEMDLIGDRKAEIQVRTTLQHAWADILHDRIYKTTVSVPSEWRREANRLAALLEKVDDSFSHLSDALDSQTSAYRVFLSRSVLAEEIDVLKAILAAEKELAAQSDEERRVALTLRLGRLLIAAERWTEAVTTLSADNIRTPEFLIELGQALCQAAANPPDPDRRQQGLDLLHSVAALDEPVEVLDVYGPSHAPACAPPGLRAKALYYLGQIYSLHLNNPTQALKCFLKATALRPDNPYYHVAYVQTEICHRQDSTLLNLAASGLRNDLDRCRQHVALGIELPNALFTIARTRFLLGEHVACLCSYTKAIAVALPNDSCIPQGLIDSELKILECLAVVNPALVEQVLTLLHLARWLSGSRCQNTAAAAESRAWLDQRRFHRDPPFKTPVLLVIGGASLMPPKKLQTYYGLLFEALEGFQGTVVSGGTTVGIPDVVGNVTRALQQPNATPTSNYDLIAYLPEKSGPQPVSEHPSYKIAGRTRGSDFTELEPIACWVDLLLGGVDPAKVMAVGYNGGRVASFEYRLALAFGATVGVLRDSGRAAAALLADPDWKDHPRLHLIPEDSHLVWALVNRYSSATLSSSDIDVVAPIAHEFYRQRRWEKGETSDEALKPWDNLDPGIGFQESNKAQVAFVDNVLRKVGFHIEKVDPGHTPVPLRFTKEEIDHMAQLEHARWVLERIAKGWVYGKKKDPEKKISPYLVPWKDLPKHVKVYDQEAVSLFPSLLTQLGYEIRRRGAGHA